MSRILRRPMFRGGPVDSYGTGIASGLADGGRVRLFNGGDLKTGSEIKNAADDKWKNYYMMDSGVAETFPGESDIYKSGVVDQELLPGSDEGTGTNWLKWLADKGPEGSQDLHSSILADLDAENIKKEEGKIRAQGFLPAPGPEKGVLPGVNTEPKGEVTFSNSSDTDASTVVESDLESMIANYENFLTKGSEERYDKRIKKARIQDISDVGLDIFARSTKPGATVQTILGETAERMIDKPSRTEQLISKKDDSLEKIKQTAAMLGIKGEQAQKLYETKLKNQSGQLQKAVEYIKDINPGMTDKEALATYQRRPRSLAETVGKYKKQDGAIMPSGITLAAGEWFLDDYQGELPTDGNIKQGDAAKGKKDGAYTDKAKGLIFVIKDEIVTDVSKFEN